MPPFPRGRRHSTVRETMQRANPIVFIYFHEVLRFRLMTISIRVVITDGDFNAPWNVGACSLGNVRGGLL